MDLARLVEVECEADEHGGQADKAVQDGDQLGHRRHLDARSEDGTDDRSDGDGDQDRTIAGDAVREDGCADRHDHPDDAIPVTGFGGLLAAQAA